MKKFAKFIVITVIATMLLTIGAWAGATFHLSRMYSDYGINSYVLSDSATGVEYIVVEGTTGIAVTPRIHK
jgi:hypothetical protein